jgi:hypothetical protein
MTLPENVWNWLFGGIGLVIGWLGHLIRSKAPKR